MSLLARRHRRPSAFRKPLVDENTLLWIGDIFGGLVLIAFCVAAFAAASFLAPQVHGLRVGLVAGDKIIPLSISH